MAGHIAIWKDLGTVPMIWVTAHDSEHDECGRALGGFALSQWRQAVALANSKASELHLTVKDYVSSNPPRF